MGSNFRCDDQWFTLSPLFLLLFLYFFYQKKHSYLVIAVVRLLCSYIFMYLCDHKEVKANSRPDFFTLKQSKESQPPSDHGGCYGFQAQDKCDKLLFYC